MNEGDVALTPLPQANGLVKLRPAILLRQMPGFGDWLVCGVSSQLHQAVPGFDDLVLQEHSDYPTSGLKVPSLIRLGFLAVLPSGRFVGGDWIDFLGTASASVESSGLFIGFVPRCAAQIDKCSEGLAEPQVREPAYKGSWARFKP